MITTRYHDALVEKQILAAKGIQGVIRNHPQGYEIVSLYDTLTPQQRAGLAVADDFYRAKFDEGSFFNAIQFEIYGIQELGTGEDLGNQLTKLGLLQKSNGQFCITQTGINLMDSVDIEKREN